MNNMYFLGVLLVFVIIGLPIYLIVRLIVHAINKDKSGKSMTIQTLSSQVSYLTGKISLLENKMNIIEEALRNGKMPAIEKIEEQVQPIKTEEKTVETGQKQAEREEKSIEMKVGGKWFLWIGIITVLFGVGYFLKYAFDNGWISESVRVIMGLITGFIFIIIGNVTHKKYANFSNGITGGGIAVLYLSIFSAFQFYKLIDTMPAYAFMILVTATAVVFSIKYNSVSISTIALIGGFLTPLLLSTGIDNQIGLFTYIALLDIGILVLSYYREWNILRYLSFLGTYFIFALWAGKYYSCNKVMLTEIFLAVFFIVFAMQSFLQNVVKGLKTRTEDLLLMFLNAFVYYGITYYIFSDSVFNKGYTGYLAFIALALAVFYFSQGYFAFKKNKENKQIIMILLGLTVTFITVAVIVQLENYWITIGWAVESLILVFLGFKLNNRELRRAGLAVTGLVLIRLIFWDTYIPITEYQFLINKRTAAFVSGFIAIFGSAYLYLTKNKEESEKNTAKFLATTGNLLVFWLITAEIVSYFNFSGLVDKESSKQMTISIAWAVYSIILMIIGIFRKYSSMRLLSMIIFFITILKVFLFDISNLSTIYRIMSFIVLGVILLLAAFLYNKYKDKILMFTKGE